MNEKNYYEAKKKKRNERKKITKVCNEEKKCKNDGKEGKI